MTSSAIAPHAPLRLVVLGLSLSSSWGNGHATTWRTLLKGLAERGHKTLFLERDQPWYAENRDLPDPSFCRLVLYQSLAGLAAWRDEIAAADLVIVGSYVPDGVTLVAMVRHWAQRLAFYDIDTPVTTSNLQRGACAYLDKATIPLFDLYLSFTAGPLLRQLEHQHGAVSARALYCAADSDLYTCTLGARPLPRWDLGYLGTYSSDRQPALERLLIEPARLRPDCRFVVAGPQYPPEIVWPKNVERFDHLPPGRHAEFYGSLGWTLNITRSDMVAAGYSPSVRLFEAAACGTPIVSDEWQGIDDVFERGRELVTAQSSYDICIVLEMAASRRAAIGEAAHKRFLGEHTASHRAVTLETYFDDLNSERCRTNGGRA